MISTFSPTPYLATLSINSAPIANARIKIVIATTKRPTALSKPVVIAKRLAF